MSAIALDPLIAEAKQRARRRRLLLLVAAGLLAASAAGFELSGSGSSGSPSAVPWVPTKPNLGPANPPLAPACTASQLRASLTLKAGTTSLIGGMELVNRSSQRCSLLGRPRLSFANATSGWRETRSKMNASVERWLDAISPPRGTLRALVPGAHVSVPLTWSNWCGARAKSTPMGVTTQAPTAIVLTLPSGEQKRMRVVHEPFCTGGPGSASTLAAGDFRPFLPEGGSSFPDETPRILAGPQVRITRDYGPVMTAHPGDWVSYTVALTNHSGHTFRFGRACPRFVEGFDHGPLQMYVLNCHGLGPIPPGRSERFAMRIRVPRHPDDLGAMRWTLAPNDTGSDIAASADLWTR